MLRRAVNAYDPAFASDDAAARAFLESLAEVEPIHLKQWAQCVQDFPEYDARTLLGELLEFVVEGAAPLPSLLASTTADWRSVLDEEGKQRNPLGLFPRDASELFFRECVHKHGLDLDEVNALCDALPDNAFRVDLVDVAMGVIAAHPECDLVLLRSIDFRPMPIDYAALAPEDIVPTMRRLSAMPCLHCRLNTVCAARACLARPQDGGTFRCAPGFHFCSPCAYGLSRHRRKLALKGDKVMEVMDLKNAVLAVDDVDLDCSTVAVAVDWAPKPVTRLKLLSVDGAPTLWHDHGCHVPRVLRVYQIEDVDRRVGAGSFVDIRNLPHVFTPRPLRHNGSDIGWWAVVDRFFCAGSSNPTYRGPLDSRYLTWGKGTHETGRVRIKA